MKNTPIKEKKEKGSNNPYYNLRIWVPQEEQEARKAYDEQRRLHRRRRLRA